MGATVGWPVVRYRASGSNAEPIRAASSVARLSSQTMAGRVGWPALSTGISVSPWLEMASAATSRGAVPA